MPAVHHATVSGRNKGECEADVRTVCGIFLVTSNILSHHFTAAAILDVDLEFNGSELLAWLLSTQARS